MDDGLCPDDKPKTWTLAQVKARNPRDYARAVRLLALGISYRDVADACRLSPNVISRIAADETSLVASKERLGKVCRGVARMAFDIIGERLADPEQAKDISASQLAVIGGISAEKGELLLGGVTSRVESVPVPVLSEDQYLAELNRLSMGSGARESGQKDEAPKVMTEGATKASDEVIDLP